MKTDLKFKALFTLLAWTLPLSLWAQVPTITNFTPKRGGVGTTITITGTNFSTTPANNIVWFGAVKSPVLTATSTTLTVKVPAGATYERVSVTVNGLTAWTRENFLPTFQGTGTLDFNSFAENVLFSGGGQKVVVTDIDGDGKPDAVCAARRSLCSFCEDFKSLFIHRNNSVPGFMNSGSFNAPYTYTAADEIVDFTLEDLDGDGKKDLVVLSTQSETNFRLDFLRNVSSVGSIDASSFILFGSRLIVGGATAGGLVFSLNFSDLNLDGKTDFHLMISSSFTSPVAARSFVGQNTSASESASFDLAQSGPLALSNSSVSSGMHRSVLTNLNSDNKPDVIVEYERTPSSSNTYTKIGRNNNGTGQNLSGTTFSSDIYYLHTPYNSWDWAHAFDIDLDGKNDLIYTRGSVRQNVISGPNIDANSFLSPVSYGTSTPYWPDSQAFIDVNGDGTGDIVGGHQVSGPTSIVEIVPNLMSGPGTITQNSFGTPSQYQIYGGTAKSMVMADMDGDGKPDIITCSEEGLSVMRNQTPSTGGVLTIGNASAGIGGSVTLPITATSLTGIEGFQFTIAYDQTKLSYQSCTNWAAGINPANVIITNNAGTGKVTFVYNDNAFSIANGTFFNINFNVIAGSPGNTAVSWNDVPTPREFINSVPNLIEVTYGNGNVNIVNATYSISGVVSYDNGSSTPMNAITVELLNSSNTVIATTVTDGAGQYLFSGLSNGNYTVRPSTTKPWGGATSLDLTLYKKHIGNVPGFILSGIRLASGDVNLSTTLSSLDITLIKQRIGAQISSFQSGDWVFENGAVTVSGSNTTKNIKALCYGDANGSHNP
jgi:hypothetical protein